VSWVWVVFLLLGYLLSVGPAARITQSAGARDDWIDVVYAPLILLADRSDTVADALWWYKQAWGYRIIHTPIPLRKPSGSNEVPP
jgi:hypothetical protein